MKESVYVSQYLDSLQFEELSGVVKTDLFFTAQKFLYEIPIEPRTMKSQVPPQKKPEDSNKNLGFRIP